MATIGGSRVLGLDKLIGSLEPGKGADLITVSMKGARQTPMYNPVSHLVYVSRGDDVQTTIVNGRVLMRDRKVLTMNEPAVLAAARVLAEKVKSAVKQLAAYSTAIYGRFRYFSAKSRPYPTTKRSSIVKPM